MSCHLGDLAIWLLQVKSRELFAYSEEPDSYRNAAARFIAQMSCRTSFALRFIFRSSSPAVNRLPVPELERKRIL